MKKKSPLYFLLFAIVLLTATGFNTNCRIYKFSDVGSIPDSIKTIKIRQFENRASYVNPQISQRLSDRLRQKITNQTKLSQTNNDNADWEISATITQYTFTTSAISNQQVTTNRLTVGVHVILNKIKDDAVKEYDVNRGFDFKGTLSFQQAENELMDEMTRTITDEIFNKLFAEW